MAGVAAIAADIPKMSLLFRLRWPLLNWLLEQSADRLEGVGAVSDLRGGMGEDKQSVG